jgi:hypothetical protein
VIYALISQLISLILFVVHNLEHPLNVLKVVPFRFRDVNVSGLSQILVSNVIFMF